MNLVAIANACAVECERQQVGILELGWLVEAYRNVANNGSIAFELVSDFQRIGWFVEREKNADRFRKTPVTFVNGGSSCPPHEVQTQMNKFIENLTYYRESGADIPTDVFVKEFLWIHPFRDGNGRVAFLLQNFLDGTLDNPQPLRVHF